MSAPQFTPGPWRYGPAVVTGKMGILGADDIFVCGQLLNAPGFEDMAEANANLIAAAPDLFEALELVLDTYGFDSSTDSSIWQAVTAALAKARGEVA